MPSRSPNGLAVLIGFMGAGKSTVGSELGRQLSWPFVDLDDRIASEAGISVAQIFTHHGESHFRAAETRHLQVALELPRPLVLAVGGGAIESSENRSALGRLERSQVFYLHAPLTELLRRCFDEAGVTRPQAFRPVLAEAEIRFERRIDHYESLGHPVPTLGRTPSEIALSIAGLLQMKSQDAAEKISPPESASEEEA
jgi:shikimate kinase